MVALLALVVGVHAGCPSPSSESSDDGPCAATARCTDLRGPVDPLPLGEALLLRTCRWDAANEPVPFVVYGEVGSPWPCTTESAEESEAADRFFDETDWTRWRVLGVQARLSSDADDLLFEVGPAWEDVAGRRHLVVAAVTCTCAESATQDLNHPTIFVRIPPCDGPNCDDWTVVPCAVSCGGGTILEAPLEEE